MRIAMLYPEFLTDTQRYIWLVVQETAAFWKRYPVPKRPTPEDLRWDVLAQDWPRLEQRARKVG